MSPTDSASGARTYAGAARTVLELLLHRSLRIHFGRLWARTAAAKVCRSCSCTGL